MALAGPMVMVPDWEAIPVPVKAPPVKAALATVVSPAPLMVRGSALAALVMFRVAPETTVVAPAVVPRPTALVMETVPALMVDTPV